MVYQEVKDDITSFLRLYRLSKVKGMSARHVINLLEIVMLTYQPIRYSIQL
jgi:hypothetical protein